MRSRSSSVETLDTSTLLRTYSSLGETGVRFLARVLLGNATFLSDIANSSPEACSRVLEVSGQLFKITQD